MDADVIVAWMFCLTPIGVALLIAFLALFSDLRTKRGQQ